VKKVSVIPTQLIEIRKSARKKKKTRSRIFFWPLTRWL